MHVRVGVEATALVPTTAASAVGEPSTCLLDQENPRSVIPQVAALHEEPIDLTTHQLHQCEGTRCSKCGFKGKTTPGLGVERIEKRTRQARSSADPQPLGVPIVWPRRLECTSATRRPPLATQRRSRHDCDLRVARNLERDMHAPVGVTPAEEERTVDRIEDPQALGVTESPELLAQQGIARHFRIQHLAKQVLDRPICFGDRRSVRLRRCLHAHVEVRESELCSRIRAPQREVKVRLGPHRI